MKSGFNPSDPDGHQARIKDLAFKMRDLADAGTFLAHPDHNAETGRDWAGTVLSVIRYLAEEQLTLVYHEEERLEAAHAHMCQCREAKK